MKAPILWIVAGSNGAGKSTCVSVEPIANLVRSISFLNPDDRTLAKVQLLGYQGFIDAPIDAQTRLFHESANEVFAELNELIRQCSPVGIETVLSTDKYRSVVESVRDKQGFVGLIYVALQSASLASERVAIRVKRGGHGIPDEKIADRWHRSLANLAWFASHASAFWIIDNSESDPNNSRRILATGTLGLLDFVDETAFPELKAALSSLPRK